MDLVIQHLDGFGARSSIASMRLVSKAWLAAVIAYPGILSLISIEKQADLAELHKLMPNMVGLEMVSLQKELNLEPISALTHLTYLSLSGHDPFGELYADLSPLPKSLRKLQISMAHVPPDCFENLKFVELRSLSFEIRQNEEPEVWKLLQCLPKLEVMFIAGSLWRW